MQPLHMNKMVLFPPVLLHNQNLKAAFELCQGELTQGRAEAFIAAQASSAYGSFEHFAPPFVGQLWSLSEGRGYAGMIAAFVDKTNRLYVTLLDNDPALPEKERGANLVLLSKGYVGGKPSVALLSKNEGLIRTFSSLFPGRAMIDETIFSPPKYLSYQEQLDTMQHLSSGHTEGKTCQRCQKEAVSKPAGFGFGSNS